MALGEEDFPRPYTLSDHPALYRAFADVEPSLDGVLGFAGEYGLLLHRLDLKDPGVAEPVAAWAPRVTWMKHMTRLWDQARPRGEPRVDGEGGIKSLVRWNGIYPEVREPDVGAGPFVPAAWRGREWWAPKLTSYTRDEGEAAESRPAVAYVIERVSEELGRVLHPRLAVQYSPRFQAVFRSRPSSLWEALVLQFATAIAEGKRYRRCAVCQKVLEYKTEMGREDRTACSTPCRQRIFRQRKEEARQLSRQGVAVEEVARRMETDEATIVRWLLERKGR